MQYINSGFKVPKKGFLCNNTLCRLDGCQGFESRIESFSPTDRYVLELDGHIESILRMRKVREINYYRIAFLQRQITNTQRLATPYFTIKKNPTLQKGEYRLFLRDDLVCSDRVLYNMNLLIDKQRLFYTFQWISIEESERLRKLGYQVIDSIAAIFMNLLHSINNEYRRVAG